MKTLTPLPPPCTFSTAIVDGHAIKVHGWAEADILRWAKQNGIEVTAKGYGPLADPPAAPDKPGDEDEC